ncbi:hypothetical protein, partial [Micromonospora globbae]|uniref:hypothetical protein n=1 Tax=Micromonospora globbae TaxID=1894969 RepID=UPI0019575B74
GQTTTPRKRHDLAKDGATSICEAGQTSLVRAPPDDKINENLQPSWKERQRHECEVGDAPNR